MANLIPLFVISVAFTANFFVREFEALPPQTTYAPDLAIALASAAVVVRLTATARWSLVPLKYILTMLGFVYVLVVGFIINQVGGDTIFAGIRTYLRFVPVFLIPFAFAFTARELSFQLKFVGALLVMQIPITIWQRFYEYRHLATGDVISGSLGITSSVAILSAGAIVWVAWLYIDKRVSAVAAVILILLFLFPAGLSETKATPIFIAVGGSALLYLRRRDISLRTLAFIGGSAGIALAVFVGLYNQLYAGHGGFFDQLTDSRRVLDSYNMTGVETEPLKISREPNDALVNFPARLREDERNVGRIDSVRLPFEALHPHEKVRLVAGLGAGNVGSTFGSGGDYRYLYRELGATSTTLATLLWETGILGTLFFLVFLVLVGRDSWSLARQEGLIGTMAGAHVSLTAMVGLGLIYVNLFHIPEVFALYVYLSGAVIYHQAVLRRSGTMRMAAPRDSMIASDNAYSSDKAAT